MRKKYSIINKDIDKPLKIDDFIIYGRGEITNSTVGTKCIIGEFSRVRDCILGNHVKIDRNNFLKDVEIGDNSYTGPFDMVFKCKIGKFTSISYGVTIGPPEHNYRLLSSHPLVYDSYYGILNPEDLLSNSKLERKLEIGNDVWIGCNTTILRGIRIGDGAVIGANSLVNKNVPPYAIVAGTPAKIIKYRFEQEIIDRLLELNWWDWDNDKIERNKLLFTSELNLKLLNQIL